MTWSRRGVRVAIRAVFPNPVRSSATICYSVAETGEYDLEIYDITGRRITTLNSGNIESGNHTAVWDASSNSGSVIPNGVFFVRLHGCGETAVQNFVVLK